MCATKSANVILIYYTIGGVSKRGKRIKIIKKRGKERISQFSREFCLVLIVENMHWISDSAHITAREIHEQMEHFLGAARARALSRGSSREANPLDLRLHGETIRFLHQLCVDS